VERFIIVLVTKH